MNVKIIDRFPKKSANIVGALDDAGNVRLNWWTRGPGVGSQHSRTGFEVGLNSLDKEHHCERFLEYRFATVTRTKLNKTFDAIG
jgi:hypothetical protein